MSEKQHGSSSPLSTNLTRTVFWLIALIGPLETMSNLNSCYDSRLKVLSQETTLVLE